MREPRRPATGAPGQPAMRLRVFLAEDILLDVRAARIVAEAENGSFGLLPRHADFVTVLVPGIVAITSEDGGERYVGIDDGVLVKIADDVMISTRGAVEGDDLGTLQSLIEARFRRLDERESAARSALARLEAGLARRFIELRN